MNEFANRILTLATFAGIAGLVILNWKGSNTLLTTVGNATTSYIKTVQGR
jgi:hypothetical protein